MADRQDFKSLLTEQKEKKHAGNRRTSAGMMNELTAGLAISGEGERAGRRGGQTLARTWYLTKIKHCAS